jgi:hypothetical protein
VILSIGIPNKVAIASKMAKMSVVVTEENTMFNSKTHSMLIFDLHFQPYSLYPLTQVKQFVVDEMQV